MHDITTRVGRSLLERADSSVQPFGLGRVSVSFVLVLLCAVLLGGSRYRFGTQW
jgi:hypothetical protein